MDRKTTGIISYITIIGWVIAYCAGDKSAKLHLNQGLVLGIVGVVGSFISFIPFLGWVLGPIIGLVAFIFSIMGIVNAAQDRDEKLPIIGDINIL